jgi:hypothetical protein
VECTGAADRNLKFPLDLPLTLGLFWVEVLYTKRVRNMDHKVDLAATGRVGSYVRQEKPHMFLNSSKALQ